MHHAPYPINDTNKKLRICIVTDAWHPQTNGVVRTLSTLRTELKKRGLKVFIISPNLFKTVPCPTYPEIKLSLAKQTHLKSIFIRIKPDAIHIATEGPIGWAARNACIQQKRPFTTAYHTAFPEYVEARSPIPAKSIYPFMRYFHRASHSTLVATPSVRNNLISQGFDNLRPWSRGVDTDQFYPDNNIFDFPRPILLYVGRIAVEKNLKEFLNCSIHGTKVLVGDGPQLKGLQSAYPDAHFLGPLYGSALRQAYSSADVFVFPSKTDTFGLVMIEALACGTPVAALPVQGPLDVLGQDGTGPFKKWPHQIAVLDNNLTHAIHQALNLDRNHCIEFASLYSWKNVAEEFLDALQIHRPPSSIQEKQETLTKAM